MRCLSSNVVSLLVTATVTVLLLTSWTSSVIFAQDIRLPPSIMQSSLAEKIYRQDDEILLECLAYGVPEPQYEWLKNGIILQPASNIFYPSEGSVLIKPLTSLDEGYYQCRASNEYGVALSNITVLQRAVLQPYGQATVAEKTGLMEGQPFKLEYVTTKCVPRPTFSWGIANDIVDKSQIALTTDRRVQIDDDGNLHFSYLLKDDMRNGKLYKCNIYNPYLDFTHGGSYARLNITTTGGLKPFAPVYAFSSVTPLVALEGRNITLRCFFSGYPDPTLVWSRDVGGQLPVGRYSFNHFNSEMVITKVQMSDEGDYKCRAMNSKGEQHYVIQIDVQVSPVFRSRADRPVNVNVTEGDDITITCNATAEPIASVQWLKNGAALNPANLPPRMKISADGTKLTISNVCKLCKDRPTDLQVIQCNASNVHGYAFADGYVNVLQRTKIAEPPTDLDILYNETSAMFHCWAVSDDSTPVAVTWSKVEKNGQVSPITNTSSEFITLSPDSTLLTFKVSENMTWKKLQGVYRCYATNGYSNDSIDTSLTVQYPIIQFVTEPAPVEDRLAAAGIGDFWWLFVLLAVILFLLILLICCCFCVHRRKGDTYKVDEKERNNGNDPEKELANTGFHDYRRPDSEPLKGSRASLVSSAHSNSDDDASSLNEYGDIDAGKFNEDGSFIGDYGTANRPKRDGTTETFA